ncbi:MAG TPA: amidohydrolase [Candidatus Acidoferrales bacterium]|nr:amidohydrolase [Candidatus Acidoferrales bacterium]
MTQTLSLPEGLAARTIQRRRDFHRFPELGLTEFRTASAIASTLQALGLEVQAGHDVMEARSRVGVPPEDQVAAAFARAREEGADPSWLARFEGGYTGVVGTLRGAHPGPAIALRCDIDALPILESDEREHVPAREGFVSQHRGVMHACGHDVHAAIGLGVAEALAARREQLHGTVKFLFQPAEEGGRGAIPMRDAGVVDDVDYFIAIHAGMDSESGVFYPITIGWLVSAKLDVTFTGKSAHAGGRPNEGRNALLAAAHAVVGLYGIARHHAGRSRVNVGVLQAGSGRNVIADRAFFMMEVRGETEEICDYMLARADSVIRGAAQAQEVGVDIVPVGRTTSAESSRSLAEAVARAASSVPNLRTTLEPKEAGGSEDATFLMRRVQERGGLAIYACVGSHTPSGHHTPRFDVAESDIVPAVQALATAIAAVGENPPLSS